MGRGCFYALSNKRLVRKWIEQPQVKESCMVSGDSWGIFQVMIVMISVVMISV